MKWENLSGFYESLKRDARVEPDTKIQIKYNTKKKRNNTTYCKIDNFKEHISEILKENKDIVAMAIHLVNKKAAIPVFRYNEKNIGNKTLKRKMKVLPSNNHTVRQFKNFSPKSKNVLTEMAARIIMEMSEDESNATENTESS